MENNFRPVLTIRIFGEDKCFGPGVAVLLRRVRELHSLRAAAMSMGMAYSKAWRIIKRSEELTGCKLLLSRTGGAHGGGACLTQDAEQILSDFTAFRKEVDTEIEKAFKKYFAN